MSGRYNDDFPKISRIPEKGRQKQKMKNVIKQIGTISDTIPNNDDWDEYDEEYEDDDDWDLN